MTEAWPPSADAPGPGGRDPRLALFASGGNLDGAVPSGQVLATLESLAAPSRPGSIPFAGSTHNEDAGMLAAVTAVESHAAGLKLALVRQIIRRHAPAAPGGALPGPDTWDEDLSHDVAAILRIAWQSTATIIDLAWQLEARLPGAGELLDRGILSYYAMKIVADEFSVLDDAQVREAERLLLDHDLGADDMTPGTIRRLSQHIACAVDPEGAARRREQKERNQARLKFYIDHGGTMNVFGTGLPADQALCADKNIQARALGYKAAGIREKMDVLRVQAWLDLANGVSVAGRLAAWTAEQAEKDRTGADNPGCRAWEAEQRENEHRDRHGDPDVPFPATEPGDLDDRFPGDGDSWSDGGDGDPDGPPFPGGEPGGEGPAEDDPGGGPGNEDGDGGPSGGGSGPRGGGSGTDPTPADRPGPGLPALVNLTIPLADVLGRANRPGEAPGFGAIDPDLAAKLADAATRSQRSEFCVTFTGGEYGHAVAHGCATLIRDKKLIRDNKTRDGPPAAGWDFTPDDARPGPAGGYGAWILRLPDGRRYRVDVHKIPVEECDHRYATGAYRPTGLLRHLVEVRDGVCTFTTCSHPARSSDFEHAIPYHEGGATDACNGGMRSRRCHRVKQSRNWRVTQPLPGWHTWTTPSGRSYTKGPRSYPA